VLGAASTEKGEVLTEGLGVGKGEGESRKNVEDYSGEEKGPCRSSRKSRRKRKLILEKGGVSVDSEGAVEGSRHHGSETSRHHIRVKRKLAKKRMIGEGRARTNSSNSEGLLYGGKKDYSLKNLWTHEDEEVRGNARKGSRKNWE